MVEEQQKILIPNFCIKTETGDKIKYNRFPKNIETTEIKNTNEHPKKTTEINWD